MRSDDLIMGKFRKNPLKPKRQGKKVKVGKVGALPEGRGATVKLKDGSEVALFNVGGKYRAIENFCPHKGFPLADSRTYGNSVECDLHGYRFDLKTGQCFTKSSCSIDAYEVSIEEDWITILV